MFDRQVVGVGNLLCEAQTNEAGGPRLAQARDGQRAGDPEAHVRRADLHEGVPLREQGVLGRDAEAALRDGPHAARAPGPDAPADPPAAAGPASVQRGPRGRRATRHRQREVRDRQLQELRQLQIDRESAAFV